MLVLSRKREECVIIDGDIRIMVVDIDGGRVRIGIDAPRHVSIRRTELAPHQSVDSTAGELSGPTPSSGPSGG